MNVDYIIHTHTYAHIYILANNGSHRTGTSAAPNNNNSEKKPRVPPIIKVITKPA